MKEDNLSKCLSVCFCGSHRKVLFRRAVESDVKSAVKTAYTCLGLEHGTSSVEDMVMCDGCESWFHW